MLDISSGLDELGGLRWQLALCLLLCWVLVFLGLSTGVKSLGKVNQPSFECFHIDFHVEAQIMGQGLRDLSLIIGSFCFTRRSLKMWYCGKTIHPSA